MIVSSNAERIQEAIKSIGGEAQGQAVGVSDEKAVGSFSAKLGAFHHLVFTAGHRRRLISSVHLISVRKEALQN